MKENDEEPESFRFGHLEKYNQKNKTKLIEEFKQRETIIEL